jgi:hypothetical protein
MINGEGSPKSLDIEILADEIMTRSAAAVGAAAG